MTGAEIIALVGLISSVISIIEASRDIYDAATSTKGLHQAFRSVALNIPLVLSILRDCKSVQEQADLEYASTIDSVYKHDLEVSAEAVRTIMEACESDMQKLNAIFQSVVPQDQASWFERYRKAAQAVMPDKKHKVEDLMKDILEKLQLLQTNRFFKVEAEKRAENVTDAIQELSELPPSLPNEVGSGYHHSGSGPMNVNPGTGTQRIHTRTGGSNNRQYNADSQTFHGN